MGPNMGKAIQTMNQAPKMAKKSTFDGLFGGLKTMGTDHSLGAVPKGKSAMFSPAKSATGSDKGLFRGGTMGQEDHVIRRRTSNEEDRGEAGEWMAALSGSNPGSKPQRKSMAAKVGGRGPSVTAEAQTLPSRWVHILVLTTWPRRKSKRPRRYRGSTCPSACAMRSRRMR